MRISPAPTLHARCLDVPRCPRRGGCRVGFVRAARRRGGAGHRGRHERRAEGGKTTFTVTLSKPVRRTAHVMERPDRVIVDLPEVTFHLPAETGRKREGLIASFRYGLFAPGRSRVVMDLAQPALVSRIDTSPDPTDGTVASDVELTRTDRESSARRSREPASAASRPRRSTGGRANPSDDEAGRSCSIRAMAASIRAPAPRPAWSRRTSCSPSPSS